MRKEGWERTTVNIPILASGDPVEINDDFEAILLCPTDSLGQVATLALQVRLTWTHIVGPIADRDPNVVQSINRYELTPEVALNPTHPAAAIIAKSFWVIQLFQWLVNAARATLGSWYCPNVHSSTMAGLPVLSNKDGVIHGFRESRVKPRGTE